MILHLQEGETVQDAVRRYEKPDPGFFARPDLPPRIPKPEIQVQVGMSTLKDGRWQDVDLDALRRLRKPTPGSRPGRRAGLWMRGIVRIAMS